MCDVLTVEEHFVNTEPHIRPLYEWLLISVRQLYDVEEVAHPEGIHLALEQSYIAITINLETIHVQFCVNHKITDARFEAVEQITPQDFRHTVLMEDQDEIDEQLLDWLKEAYAVYR